MAEEFEGLKPKPAIQTESTMSFLIEIPTLPNFVKLQGYESSASIPIESLSENQIRNLGKRWTEALLVHSENRAKKL